MDLARLEQLLDGTPHAGRLRWLDSIDSTNDELRRLVDAGAESHTTLIAGAQTSGRGRRNRRWHSPQGMGLYLSTVLVTDSAPRALTRWAIAAAVAACDACRRTTGLEVTIKWPNDLLVDGRKLAGCLTEARGRPGSVSELIVGFGLNLSMDRTDFPAELRESCTSVLLAGGPSNPGTAERIAAEFLRGLVELGSWLDSNRWSELAERWAGLAPDWATGTVRVRSAGSSSWRDGRARGLAPDGGLRVERSDGILMTVYASDSVERAES